MKQLFFNNSSFCVLLLTDLHYGEDIGKDFQSDAFQKYIIDLEKPDFVVFNGDMSSDYTIHGTDFDWWTAQWHTYTSYVRQKNIPYALNIGNHDTIQSNISILEYDMKYGQPSSYTKPDPYQAIPIYDNDTIKYYLWLLSSGKDKVDSSVVEEWSSNNTRGQMFVHISVPETLSLAHKRGIKTEFTGCSHENTGLIRKTLLDQHVDCIWHGHDHLNNFNGYIQYKSLKQHIAVARKSGFGGYAGLLPGATIIKIHNYGQSWTTYVRLSTGQTIDAFNYQTNIWSDMQFSCDATWSITYLVCFVSIIVISICFVCAYGDMLVKHDKF